MYPFIICDAPDNAMKPFTDPFNHVVNNDTFNDTFADPSNNYINSTPIHDNIPLDVTSTPYTADGPIDAVIAIDNFVAIPNVRDDD